MKFSGSNCCFSDLTLTLTHLGVSFFPERLEVKLSGNTQKKGERSNQIDETVVEETVY